ncbi:MAG: hypothetical protein JW724_02155 [Candidatus Altiarchaeota archaeon]|nr:hypothetical protein [Candidatus Altiarchaeota archaeon]
MDGLLDVSNWKDFMLFLILICSLTFIILLFNISAMHLEIERRAKFIPARIRVITSNLKSASVGLSKENQDVRGREKEQVVEEAKRISQLWKSRREQLQMGYWEKMEARADELTELQNQKQHIEELIKRTKVKYHKREIDEESFREIVKDYQKQLMEINVKIWELEKNLG